MWITCVEGKECVDNFRRGEGVWIPCIEGKVCVDSVHRGEGVCAYRA